MLKKKGKYTIDSYIIESLRLSVTENNCSNWLNGVLHRQNVQGLPLSRVADPDAVFELR